MNRRLRNPIKRGGNKRGARIVNRGVVLGTLILICGGMSTHTPCGRPAKASPAQAAEAAHVVEKIEIEYQHSGWGSTEEHYLIKPYGNDFIILPDTAREGAHGQAVAPTVKAIPAAQVGQLLEAWDAPAKPRAQGLHAVAATASSQ